MVDDIVRPKQKYMRPNPNRKRESRRERRREGEGGESSSGEGEGWKEGERETYAKTFAANSYTFLHVGNLFSSSMRDNKKDDAQDRAGL